VIIIVGGLTFFPALALGPIVEQLSKGRFFGTGLIGPFISHLTAGRFF